MTPIPPMPNEEKTHELRRTLLAGEMPNVDDEIRKALIQGIRELRITTGMSLIAAKEACTVRHAELGLSERLSLRADFETPQDEIRFWRELCVYLADCTAATAYQEGMRKSCSKARRLRHSSICRDVATALDEKYFDRHCNHYRGPDDVAKRLQETAEDLEKL